MCTVTYLPFPGGFVLTHNRDEAPARSPQGISREKKGGDTLIFPKDTKAGGGWIVTTRRGRTACLLNGAFVKHPHQPPYRRSRGLILLDFFDWPDPDAFFSRYDLQGVEPFTFLFFAPNRLTELRWDGIQRHLTDHSPDAPRFWCSATLYPAPMQAQREQVFRQWLSQHLPAAPPLASQTPYRLPSAVYRLHRTGSVGDPENDYVMNRNGRVCTVSITQVVLRNGQVRMRYSDLLDGNKDTKRLTSYSPGGV